MNAQSKNSSLRSDMSRSFGSNACASIPRSRNAPSTALPDSSEISLSAERPPMSTATFPNLLPFIRSLSCLTNDLHFALQHHVRLAPYRVLHENNQLFYVTRQRSTLVDYEISVHGRYLGTANAPAFEAACLDHAGRVVTGRIAEYRTGVWFCEGLCRDPPRQQFYDLLASLVAVAACKPEPGGNEEIGARLQRKATAITDRVFVRLPKLPGPWPA